MEICRNNIGAVVPDDLRESYEAALGLLPSLVAAATKKEWSDGFMSCTLAAIAAAKGKHAAAEAILELNSQVASEFMKWFYER